MQRRSVAPWSRPRRDATLFPATPRRGNDFTGRCRGFGSVTDPHRWSWEAMVKVYTVTKGRCRAGNIRSVARNVLLGHHREPEALAKRLSFRVAAVRGELFQGRHSSFLFRGTKEFLLNFVPFPFSRFADRWSVAVLEIFTFYWQLSEGDKCDRTV